MSKKVKKLNLNRTYYDKKYTAISKLMPRPNLYSALGPVIQKEYVLIFVLKHQQDSRI